MYECIKKKRDLHVGEMLNVHIVHDVEEGTAWDVHEEREVFLLKPGAHESSKRESWSAKQKNFKGSWYQVFSSELKIDQNLNTGD